MSLPAHKRAPLNLWRILRRGLLYRRSRSLSALLALTVSAAVATTLLTLYASLDQKLHHEFRSFGANIVITGPSVAGMEYEAQEAGGPGTHVAPFAYAVATTDRGTPVVVVGTDFDAVKWLDPWWQVTAWPVDASKRGNGVLVGQRAAEFIGNEKELTLTFAGNKLTLTGIEHLRTGGDEDSRIYISLQTLTALTMTDVPKGGGQGGTYVRPTVIEVQVPGSASQVEAAVTRLKLAFPQADVQPVRQLVQGESQIVDRTHSLMFAAVLLIALTVAVSVLATLSASVLERRRDFALMKALGGSERQMMHLFLLETILIAAAGVLLGYLLGSAAADLISQLNFQTPTLPRLGVLPIVIALNAAIATLAAFFPVRSLRNLQPAALLKGE